MNARLTVWLCVLGFVTVHARAQPARPNAPGPWDGDVAVYRAGPDQKGEKLATFERAGVATIARWKDKLIAAHQHFPEDDAESFDKVAVRFSSDEGTTWSSPRVIRVSGLPEGMRFPFDPTLVPLPDGRIRLYFTSLRGRRFEESTPAIYSAISSDGVEYTFEPGVRFGIEGRLVIDCAVVLHRGTFHLFAPDNGPSPDRGARGDGPRSPPKSPSPPGVGYHATSPDGLKFTRVEDVRVDNPYRWLGGAWSDGKRIIFLGTREPGPPPQGPPEPGTPRPRPQGGLWLATSEDGSSWNVEDAPIVAVADPGAVPLPDRDLLVIGTTGPRPGTPSTRRRGPPPR